MKMDNKEFMDYVQRELIRAKGSDLPIEGVGSRSDYPYCKDDWSGNEDVLGFYSTISDGPNNIRWGVELVFPHNKKVEEVCLDFLSNSGVKRGYVSIGNTRRRKEYRMATTDFKTVTDILGNDPIELWSPSREVVVPDFKGSTLEEAIPTLFNCYYEG
ncbi:hypothetical protein GOV12_03865 [Candidatus Pacearchaeota archaeon]|nr:hypothetical protein [Candidatus Pacearchaeota archaeon]